MAYDFQGLKELTQKFENGEKLTLTEQDTLIAIHSIGRDGVSVNGKILYNLSPAEYEKIQIEVHSNSSLSYEDKLNILKEKLLIYANSIDFIISEIMKDRPTLEYRKQLFESLGFVEHLSKGLEILKDFK